MNRATASGVGILTGAIGLTLIVALCFGMAFGCSAYNRYQQRADAKNDVIVAKKRVGIARLSAKARFQESIGIKKSQREINRTLTPLYVSFELTQAMQAIATSGKNNSIVYLPTNPSTGLPVVPTSNSVTPSPSGK